MEATVEIVRFIHENRLVGAVSLAAFILYFFLSSRRGKQRQRAAHSDRLTSRSSEYYSTEIDELQR
ncbi:MULTISPECIES: hypothetical protein [unclassified Sulfitobacter]|uniref:hypothetical protein n=1 Tax=unclassified Sulfitobacter TaxID=196795 RepID=UPI0023E22BBA|nr:MULTISPECIES: hypothetical protein [unclassified Sulfitobacter]MDF3415577.1 hypothetical protein [Sulfitobacter sp. KE5]MDF3434123.1 hypothetical protein [Sulfitobacter sp. KE42]MDF3459844.1 hypothetical protein [Sulfitobacter sp. S74]MDF3533724.1 hypothetical protein [Sulfitobacter sp. S62]